ncbi:radical SAM protein [Bradyrhizobium sp. NBAIM08]|uniref:radical SAM/SPASM domain-containing protein n=1 Tax=Bradyrhizobium sp. NBAIM08 TaxID=2793815 RepID=UPI001CD33ADA|nr:radical SAM protein [Bradyrhizobium sp. NBAIM08]MCA1479838.1 SPASM domain-containing protein [Bradyrhizobium sp. NBAIM08]
MSLQPLAIPQDGRHLDDRLFGVDDVFLIPAWDRYLIYSPITKAIVLASSEELHQLRSMGAEGFLGILGLQRIIAQSEAATDTVPQIEQSSGQWKPTHVTFSNTQKCTLRCRYCYADGGRLDDAVIPKPIVDAALSLIVSNAAASDQQPSINFLGEGEATADWKSFTYILETFRQKCREIGKQGHVSLSTNGVFSNRLISYLVDNVDTIVFSLDGISSSHNKNRVLPSGSGSFEKIIENLREFDRLEKRYGIRCTATETATSGLPDFVEWIGLNLRTKEIHVEPVFDNSGVAKTAEPVEEPPSLAFVQQYRKARQVAAKYGIELYYSSADLKFKTGFCGVTNANNFIVTSKGIVTSCNEVLRSDDIRSTAFQYGRWNSEENNFEIDLGAVQKLRKVNVTNISKCTNCFAKFNCAGDCYAKTHAQHGDIFSPKYTSRCEVTRELTRDNLLLEILKDQLDNLSDQAIQQSESGTATHENTRVGALYAEGIE